SPPQTSPLSLHDALPIFVTQAPPRRFRHHHDARVSERLVPGAELEHVAREALDLIHADFENLALARSQPREHPLPVAGRDRGSRSEEHTSELQSLAYLVC